MRLTEIMRYRDRNVHVVGFTGAEGSAVLSFLASKKFMRLTAHDQETGENLKHSFFRTHVSLPRKKREESFRALMALPVTFKTGSEYLDRIEAADLIFAGQNWRASPANNPIEDAMNRGIPVKYLIQLYFGLSPAPIIAVTGTNGKTTVTHWMAHVLEHAGRSVLISGNDRYHPQILDRLESFSPSGYVVLEVSNRQLRVLDRGPHVAVLTNIRADHLDEHGSWDAYIKVKKRLFLLQSKDDYAVINVDDGCGSEWVSRIPAQVVPYSVRSVPFRGLGRHLGDIVMEDGTGKRIRLFGTEDVRIPGAHNLANAVAVAGAVRCAGLDPADILSGIRSFRGVRNRVEQLAVIGGIRYINDLASTNPSASEAALDAFPGPLIWIAGGDIKGNEERYRSLVDKMHDSVKALIVLKSDVGDILYRGAGKAVPCRKVSTFAEAMSAVESMAASGDIVLLSPAGAGFFSRFASANGFRNYVRRLKKRREKDRGAGNDGC